MRRPLLLFTAAALAAAALAPQAATSETVEQRIDQGLSAAGDPSGAQPDDAVKHLSISVKPDALNADDVSLAPSTGPSRLRTTLDPTGIKERIDKGLTAAGEASAIPPDYAFGAFQRGWFLTAFSLALDRAKNGDAVAETLLGVLLSRGLGVKQDLAAAADWFRLAGKGGDPEALYALGQFYLHGNGVKKDEAEAAKLFRQAADQGHPGAARELGYLLLEGKGTEKNAMLAAAYLSRSARLGDMDAQYTLAGLFAEGVGVVGDEKLAAHWFEEAAHNGHVGAEIEYAIMLYNGRGVAKDETAAAKWFRRAANEDNPAAQIRLAKILAEGHGLPRDDEAAARWYLIAKAHGVGDDSMEDWLKRLDTATRDRAAAAARHWAASRRGRAQVAAAPAKPAAAVDNALE